MRFPVRRTANVRALAAARPRQDPRPPPYSTARMSRPASSGERGDQRSRVWSARSGRSGGHDNEALDRDQDPPAAMEAEEYVDGRVVVNNSYDAELDEPNGCWHQFKKGIRCEYPSGWQHKGLGHQIGGYCV